MTEDVSVSKSIDSSAENNSGSHSSSFVSINQEEQHPNASFLPTASSSSCFDKEPGNEYKLFQQENAGLKDEMERCKQKYERGSRKNDELQGRLYKLEWQRQVRKRKETERDRERRQSKKKEQTAKSMDEKRDIQAV